MRWPYFWAGFCIAIACALLQPEQPQSIIATGLLTVAIVLVGEKGR